MGKNLDSVEEMEDVIKQITLVILPPIQVDYKQTHLPIANVLL